MQVGSIVCVRKLSPIETSNPKIKWLPVQDESTPYVIRNIHCYAKTPCATLEEGCVGYWENGDEIAINLNMLIELLPPEEVSEQVNKWADEHMSVKL